MYVKKIKPISINGNECKEFNSREFEDISVIEGGYIITPRGEIILVGENEEHCNVFSDYLNSYLENGSEQIYDTWTATKMLCELGCFVYSGIRYREYVNAKVENYSDDLCTLAFPNNIENITEIQRKICLKLIESNKSALGDREKIYVQYEQFPDTIFTKEQALSMLELGNIKDKNQTSF